MIDGQLWITTNTTCIQVETIDEEAINLPSLSLQSQTNNGSISSSLLTNNFYSDNINYTYYINTPTEQRMIWTKEPDIELNYHSDSDVNLIAKMNDDVFAQDIYSNNVAFSAKDSGSLDRMIKIFAALLATLLILWAIRQWIKP